MTSLACVPEGRPIWSDVALGAAPLLAVAAPWTRNPMMIAPGQVSATSHSFVAARHMVPALPGGCWQALLVPSHWSRVQGLLSAVQGVVAGCFASVGQVVLDPSQVSALSQTSTAARHTVSAVLTASAGQLPLLPGQVSATSHTPAAARQTVAAFTKRHEAEQHELAVPFDDPSSQSSPASTMPLPQFASPL